MFSSRFFRWLTMPEGAAPGEDSFSFFARPPVLETEDLVLRPLAMRDAKDIYAYASDPLVARYVLWDAHRSISETRSYIRYVRGLYRRGLPSAWAVTLRGSGRVIGTIGFVSYSRAGGTAEIGYSLARDCWNRGYATEALRAVLRACFDRLPELYRIEARHDVRNPASGRVMEKCGMTREGILRGQIYYKGEHADVAVCSVLRPDLPEEQVEDSTEP